MFVAGKGNPVPEHHTEPDQKADLALEIAHLLFIDVVGYSKLIGKLGAAAIQLNRKMLAEIAISDPVAFKAIVAG